MTGTEATPSLGNLFASTCWTVVLEAAESQESGRARAALAELCKTYWQPLYLYLRRKGYDRPDAQDLTQSFFFDLIQSRSFARAERAKGKFRSFLLGALKHFLADARDHDGAQKRGGNVIAVPLSEAALIEAEASHSSNNGGSAEQIFEREWAAALLRRTIARLEQEYSLAGKSPLFDCLRSHVSPSMGTAAPYEELAARLGRKPATLRMDVMRLRDRYRAVLREEVTATVQDSAQTEDELRYLYQVVTVG